MRKSRFTLGESPMETLTSNLRLLVELLKLLLTHGDVVVQTLRRLPALYSRYLELTVEPRIPEMSVRSERAMGYITIVVLCACCAFTLSSGFVSLVLGLEALTRASWLQALAGLAAGAYCAEGARVTRVLAYRTRFDLP